MIHMAFAERFRQAREKAGLSQEKLAAELGISKRMIINYEGGKFLPTTDKMPKIAKFFGVSIESLITEDEEFVSAAYKRDGARGARGAQAIVDDAVAIFAGGKLSEEDADAAMRAIQNAYWIAKEESKKKYTPKKYRVTAQDE